MTKLIDELDLITWLAERRNNARAIAETKRGADREGWLEDAGYFDRAITALSSPPQECMRWVERQSWVNGDRGTCTLLWTDDGTFALVTDATLPPFPKGPVPVSEQQAPAEVKCKCHSECEECGQRKPPCGNFTAAYGVGYEMNCTKCPHLRACHAGESP